MQVWRMKPTMLKQPQKLSMCSGYRSRMRIMVHSIRYLTEAWLLQKPAAKASPSREATNPCQRTHTSVCCSGAQCQVQSGFTQALNVSKDLFEHFYDLWPSALIQSTPPFLCCPSQHFLLEISKLLRKDVLRTLVNTKWRRHLLLPCLSTGSIGKHPTEAITPETVGAHGEKPSQTNR